MQRITALVIGCWLATMTARVWGQDVGGAEGAAEATAPAPVSAAAPIVTPTGAATVACDPSCSPGFFCRAGACVSKCNPACGRGEFCNEQRLCALIAPAVAPDRLADANGRERVVATEVLEEYRRALARFERRTIPRVIVGAGFLTEELHQDQGGVGVMGATVRVGLRKNFSRWLGTQVALGATIGGLTRLDEPTDNRSVFGALAELSGFFNAGTSYFGPFASLERRFYRRDELDLGYGPPVNLRELRWRPMVGGRIGLLVFDNERLDLNLQHGVVLGTGDAVVLLGFGLHFFANVL